MVPLPLSTEALRLPETSRNRVEIEDKIGLQGFKSGFVTSCAAKNLSTEGPIMSAKIRIAK